MKKKIDVRDFIAGVVLIVIGVSVAAYAGSQYQIGTPSRMGPGFFPTALGWILAGLGLITVLLSLRQNVHVLTPPPFRLRALLAVLGAIAFFGLTADRLGLIPATIGLVFVAALADSTYRWRRTAMLSVSLSVIAYLIFIVGLQMQLPAFAFLR